MPAPTCVQCQVGFDRIKSGIFLVEMFNDPPRPYKVWHADLWECQKCEEQIVSGYGQGPLSEHFQEHFDSGLANLKEQGAVIIYQYER